MIGEPDAGKPHVRFDEGTQETGVIAARLRPTLPQLCDSVVRGIARRKLNPQIFDLRQAAASTIAMLKDTCGNLIQLTQLKRW